MPKKSTLNVAKVDIVLIFIVNFNVLFLQKCVPSYFCPSYAIKNKMQFWKQITVAFKWLDLAMWRITEVWDEFKANQ